MTTFSQKVISIVKTIPQGQVMTYQQVATRAGRPKAYRAIGNILNKNYLSSVPCHRVIRSDGTLGGYNRGVNMKQKLLAEEKRSRVIARPASPSEAWRNWDRAIQTKIAFTKQRHCDPALDTGKAI